jgi:hypothetical protein
MILVIGSYIFDWKWTGFADRTLWDWLTLLLPAYIAVIGTYFGTTLTRQQSAIQHQVEERRARETAVQTYADQTLTLLATGASRDSQRSEDLRVLLRARARMVLARIRAPDKTTVVRFLHDAGLILREHPTVHLDGADLSRAILSGMDLREANLSGANLREAELNAVALVGADLSGAKLHDADLSGADLSGANFTDAEGVTNEELELQADSLKGATMPNGQKYEDWLKDREGRGKDVENA